MAGRKSTKKFGFDSAKFWNDLRTEIVKIVDDLAANYYESIKNDLSTWYAKDDLALEPTLVESKTDFTGPTSGTEFVNARIRSYVFAVLDSYGTGTGIDTSSPYLSDYRASEYWNPARTGTTIVGRPEGPYTDIFGNDDAYSSGRFEGRKIPRANNTRASYAIQHVEDWLMKDGETRVEREVKTFVDKFIAENAHKYFKSGG